MDAGALASWAGALVAVIGAAVALVAAKYSRRQATAAERQADIAHRTLQLAEEERHQRNAPTFDVTRGRARRPRLEMSVKMKGGNDLSHVIAKAKCKGFIGVASDVTSEPTESVDLGPFRVGKPKPLFCAYAGEPPTTATVYLTCIKAGDDDLPPWDLPPMEVRFPSPSGARSPRT